MKDLVKNVRWLGHSGFFISGTKNVAIDPFQLQSFAEKADILLISHDHFDHCSPDDIARVSSPKTVVVASALAAKKLGKRALVLLPGQSIEAGGMLISGVAAYNVNKFRQPGQVFHTKTEHHLGFVFELDGIRYYHAGDTDFVDEMHELASRGIDVAFLPVSGTYVMTSEEAGGAADAIGPRVVVPMHFGTIVGTKTDALDLQRFTKVPVVVLDPKP